MAFNSPISTSSPNFPTSVSPMYLSPRLSNYSNQPIPTNVWWNPLINDENINNTTLGYFDRIITTYTYPYSLKQYDNCVYLNQSDIESDTNDYRIKINETDWRVSSTTTFLNVKLQDYNDLGAIMRMNTASGGYLETIASIGSAIQRFYYNNLIPIFEQDNSGVSITLINGASPVSSYTTNELLVEFNNGKKYVIFFDSTVTINYNSSAKRFTLASNYTGYIGFARYFLTSDLTSLRTGKSAVVKGGMVDAQFIATNNTANLIYSWSVSGSGNALICAMKHHQNQLSAGNYETLKFLTPRGEVKALSGNVWSQTINLANVSFNYTDGVLDNSKSAEIIAQLNSDKTNTSEAGDIYFGGKDLNRIADMVLMSDDLNQTITRDSLLTTLKSKVQARLDRTNSGAKFTRDTKFRGILCGSDFGNDEYNDHHFHYGYLIKVYATILKFDLSFNTSTNKEKIEWLIREVANPVIDIDFPRFRMMDWYLGHALASGRGANAYGPDHESISEADHSFYGQALYGMVTNNSDILNRSKLILALHETTAQVYVQNPTSSTIYTGVFDNHKTIGRQFMGTSNYGVWFSGDPEAISGIQKIPISPRSSYYNKNVEWLLEDKTEFSTGSQSDGWKSINYTVLAKAGVSEANNSYNIVKNLASTDGGLAKSLALYYIAHYTQAPATNSNNNTIPTTTAGTTPNYTVGGGYVYKDGVAIQLRGANWFGAEEGRLMPTMWGNSYKVIINRFVAMGGNAFRFPVCPEFFDPLSMPTYSNISDNSNFNGKNAIQAMDVIIDELESKGVYFIFDYHKIKKQENLDTIYGGIWYGQNGITESIWIDHLKQLATRYKNKKYFLGLDVFNEPYRAKWDGSNDANNFRRAAELAGQQILAVNSNIIILVEGVSDNAAGINSLTNIPVFTNWGSDLRAFRQFPIRESFIPKNKLALAPHPYGPDVLTRYSPHPIKDKMTDSNWPTNMNAMWDGQFGALIDDGYTIIPTEFAGFFNEKEQTGSGNYGQSGLSIPTVRQKDIEMHNQLANYLASKKQFSGFYWALNDESADTSGIINGVDWYTYRPNVVAYLQSWWNKYTPPSTSNNQMNTGGTSTTTTTITNPITNSRNFYSLVPSRPSGKIPSSLR